MEKAVVLCDPLTSGRRASLDLPGIERNRKVGNCRILGLTAAVGDDRVISAALRQTNGGNRLSQAANLVEFDKNFNAISIEEKPKQPKSNYA